MIAGLVLAAGAGRRFGGGKLLAELEGSPLLEHALAAVERAPQTRARSRSRLRRPRQRRRHRYTGGPRGAEVKLEQSWGADVRARPVLDRATHA
jgi:hypothetical protein